MINNNRKRKVNERSQAKTTNKMGPPSAGDEKLLAGRKLVISSGPSFWKGMDSDGEFVRRGNFWCRQTQHDNVRSQDGILHPSQG